MTYVKYKTKDYAEWQFLVWFTSGDLSFQLKAWQGARFPTLSWEKFIGTCEKRSGSTVTSKERVLVTARSTDTFTITRSYGWDTALDFDADDYFCLHVNSDVIVDIQDEVTRLETDKLDTADYQNWTPIYAASSAWSDTYAITLTPAIASYQTWQKFRFKADVANTWAATLNVNGLGAKTIKKKNDQDLATWDIEAGQIVEVSYDGTNMQMLSQVASNETIDITSQTEDVTGDMDSDYLLEYDSSAWANRKVKPSVWKSSNAEADAWSSTSKFVTPAQIAKYAWKIVAWTSLTVSTWSSGADSSATTYEKKFEWTIVKSWTYTVTFNLRSSSWSATAYARIYKNGVAFGTERSTSSTSNVGFSEDLTFAAWDLIQVYMKISNNAYYATTETFAIKCTRMPDIGVTMA